MATSRPPMIEPAPRHRAVTAREAALAGLRQQIRAGILAPGQRISQRKAADDLECSIVPVREALQTLEAEGQVSYSPQRGYFVAALDPEELLEIYRIRALLEDDAVREAVPKLDASALRVLNILLDEVEEAAANGLVPEMIAADRRMHFTLYAASGLPRLVGLIRMLWDSTDRYRAQYYADPAHRELVSEEHRALLDAAARHDVKATLAVLRAHRRNAIATVEQALAAEATA